MARKQYRVGPDKGDWTVKTGGKTVRRFETKEPAVKEATRRARSEPGESQVIIQKKDGKIQEERTYRNDPYPPKG